MTLPKDTHHMSKRISIENYNQNGQITKKEDKKCSKKWRHGIENSVMTMKKNQRNAKVGNKNRRNTPTGA